jgi:Asp-tRNA(Asn)/Glu-tRNA(Gln) amidotransferase A subunit family amidase
MDTREADRGRPAGAGRRGLGRAASAALDRTLALARPAAEGGAYVHIRPRDELERDVAEAAGPAASPGPLAGWTLAVKDLIAVAGRPLIAGSRSRESVEPEGSDAPVVSELRRAGAVLVGTTALHELAFGVTGVNEYSGTPDNPRRPGCIPGGSSSGSAVAVAEGSARIALGTDTGGSVRIPAALCDVVGFKPSYGAYPIARVLPLAPSLDHVGLHARSIRDLEAPHAVLGGGPLREGGPPRIGVARRELEAAEPGIAARIEGALDLASREGCDLVEIDWPSQDDVFEVSTTIMFAEAAEVHRETLSSSPELLGADVRSRLEAGAAIDRSALTVARRARESLRESVRRSLSEVDCVAGPTVGFFPPTLSEGATDPKLGAKLVANTRLANVVGAPALSVPVPGDGPPAGLQLTSLTEDAVLTAGAWIERTLRDR